MTKGQAGENEGTKMTRPRKTAKVAVSDEKKTRKPRETKSPDALEKPMPPVSPKATKLTKTTKTTKTSKNSSRKDSAATSPKTSSRTSTKTSAAKLKKEAELAAGKNLVIVESPAKARTLEKILGPGYRVLASVGHVRDLPKGRLAIDVENGFEPEYIQVRGKGDVVRTLKAASEVSAKVYLASDPDREGEAISWHLATLLGLDPHSLCRIRMNEITATGVKNAIAHPDAIDIDRVDAQQARRVLDRLVGYQLSPLLWYKVQRGLSAGRVQSVALRIVCEREDEITAFVPQEYWLLDVHAAAAGGERRYVLRLEKKNGKSFTVENAAVAESVSRELQGSELVVSDFKTKESSRSAMPPFRTSTLQQEASRRLGYAPRRTMRIAQSLYEGVDIPGRGPVGLITYMRTDSFRISPEAIDSSRRYIEKQYGNEWLPAKPNFYATKAGAQDAHEAIRPTDPFLTPQSLKGNLTPEQFRLYEMIWSRFVASQMAPARVARTTLEAKCGDYALKQAGIVVLFEGWGKLWPLGVKDVEIQPAVVGEALSIEKIDRAQRFTQPPSRYTDAALVKLLEEKGIGRPSTYATIVETLLDRGYVVRGDEDRKLSPTPLGATVNTFLTRYFPDVINAAFTALMETQLDKVESGQAGWRDLVASFWKDFKPVLDTVTSKAERVSVPAQEVGRDCPECGHPLVIKRGRFGEFIACSGFPECRHTEKIIKTIGVKCPKCETGELVRRRMTKGKAKGRFFYGCSRYPECDYVSWKKPAIPKKASRAGQEGAPEADAESEQEWQESAEL